MFQNALGFLALGALPAILALHWFRRRYRPFPVSSLLLWEFPAQSSAAGRRRDRLQNSPSLWLELLTALALALALAGPRACQADAVHFVAVIDGSASMSAVDGRSSTATRALEVLEEKFAALPARSLVSVLQSGARSRFLVGPRAELAQARELVLELNESYQPSEPRHDFEQSLALGSELSDGGNVLWLTDRYDGESSEDAPVAPAFIEQVSIGRPLDNVALVHAARARGAMDDAQAGGPTRQPDSLFLTVESFSDRAVSTSVAVSSGGQLLWREALELEANQRRALSLKVPAPTSSSQAPGASEAEQNWMEQVWTVELEEDALSIDNRAYLPREPQRLLGLHADLPAEWEQALGLSLGEAGELAKWKALVPPAVRANRGSAHLSVVLGSADPVASSKARDDCWELKLLESASDKSEGVDLVGPFVLEKQHPLLRGVTLQGIVWSARSNVDLPGIPLVSAGNLTLLSEERLSQGRCLHWNYDPLRSSMHRSPDWPIFLFNLAEWRRSELEGIQRTQLALGESLVWHASVGGEYSLKGPDGSLELRAQASLVSDDLDRPGIYELRQGGELLSKVGVSFLDPSESDLRKLRSGRREAKASLSSLRVGYSWLEALLLLAAAVFVLANWGWLRSALLPQGAALGTAGSKGSAKVSAKASRRSSRVGAQ